LILDIYQYTWSEIQKHPDFGEFSRVVSRNQYPELCNISNDFHEDTLIAKKHLSQLNCFHRARNRLVLDVDHAVRIDEKPFNFFHQREPF